MAGYLDGYGAEDERRGKVWKRILLGALAAAAIAVILYFSLRGYRQKKEIATFLEHLRRREYQMAYQQWGCTPAHPCRDYSFARFMEDWGPQSPRAGAQAARVKQNKYCDRGIIATLDFGKGEDTLLWVESKDMTLGFAPWPVCNPMYKPVTQ